MVPRRLFFRTQLSTRMVGISPESATSVYLRGFEPSLSGSLNKNRSFLGVAVGVTRELCFSLSQETRRNWIKVGKGFQCGDNSVNTPPQLSAETLQRPTTCAVHIISSPPIHLPTPRISVTTRACIFTSNVALPSAAYISVPTLHFRDARSIFGTTTACASMSTPPASATNQ